MNVAARDVINLSVFMNAHPPLTTPSQERPDMPKPPDQPVFQWPSVLWKFWTPFAGKAVTLHTPEPATEAVTLHTPEPATVNPLVSKLIDSLSKPQATPSISPDPTDSQPFLIQQSPAPNVRLSQANEQVYHDAYPSRSEREDNSPQPGDNGFDVVSIRTLIFLDDP
jgi:hypothetical protein